jgi:hypothetical protein
MRRTAIVIATCFVSGLALVLTSGAQARDLDTIMKEIAGVWQNPGRGLSARGTGLNAVTPDTAKIAADSLRLQSLFIESSNEFTRLKMPEPARIAKSVADAAGALAKEAKTGKIKDAKASLAAIDQCKVCHDPVTGFREPDGAGGFKVKVQ